MLSKTWSVLRSGGRGLTNAVVAVLDFIVFCITEPVVLAINWARPRRWWLTLVVVSLALPQGFNFIVNSFYRDGWRWTLNQFHDPSTLFGSMLWFPHALAFGLVIYYLAQHSQWSTYLLGRIGAVAFAVLVPVAAFIGGWMAYDISAYDRQYGTGQNTLNESWRFAQDYVLNDASYWFAFIVTGVLAMLLSLWLRPRLFAATPDAMSSAAAQTAVSPVALADVARERLEGDDQRPEHRVA